MGRRSYRTRDRIPLLNVLAWIVALSASTIPAASADTQFTNCDISGPRAPDATSNSALESSGLENAAAISRQDLIYSHCVLLDAFRFPTFRNQLRELAANAAIEGLEQSARISDLHLRGELIGRLVGSALDAGYSGSRLLSDDVETMRQSSPDDLDIGAYASALEGRILLAEGNRVGARAALDQALLLESQKPLPSRLPDWYLILADIVSEQRPQFVHAAYLALESVRPLLPLRDPVTDESTFSLHERQVFESEIDVELIEHGGVINPQTLLRAQDVIETYRQAEIRSAYGNDCVPPLPRMVPGVLRQNEIVLYPILLADRVELLYAKGGDREYRRLPPNRTLNRETIIPLIERVRQAVAHRSGDFWRDDARKLYSALIQPIEQLLNPETTLIVVPDGPLRLLPLAALIDANNEFLIARTRLAIAPALSYTQPGDDDSGSGAWTVAAYLDRSVEIDGHLFDALVATHDEAVDAVAPGGPRSSEFLGEIVKNFDRQSLGRALSSRRFDVLHLATHAAFNGRSDESFLVTKNGKLQMSDLREMIAAKHLRGEEIELLVLSACETAVGDDEASMGFAGTAVQAGARSALASLWDVNDPSTEKLMKEFYLHFRVGESRAQSLRAAQVKLSQDYPDPYYWAAFTLIGAWR